MKKENYILINDLKVGSIIWRGFEILGIKGVTLDEKYHKCFCFSIEGNDFDYEIIKK